MRNKEFPIGAHDCGLTWKGGAARSLEFKVLFPLGSWQYRAEITPSIVTCGLHNLQKTLPYLPLTQVSFGPCPSRIQANISQMINLDLPLTV